MAAQASGEPGFEQVKEEKASIPFASGEAELSDDSPASSPVNAGCVGREQTEQHFEVPPRETADRENTEQLAMPSCTVDRQAPEPHRNALADMPRTWDDFLNSCGERSAVPVPILRQFRGEFQGGTLVLRATSPVMMQQLQRHEKTLSEMVDAWCGTHLKIEFRAVEKKIRTEAEIRKELEDHPVVRSLHEAYGAVLVRCTSINR